MNKIRIPDKLIKKIQMAITEMDSVGYRELGLFSMPELSNGILLIERLAIPSLLSCLDPEGLSEFELFQLKACFLKVTDDSLVKPVVIGDMIGSKVSGASLDHSKQW